MMAQNITQKKLSRPTLSRPTSFTIGLLLVLFWILVAIFVENFAPYHPDARFINLARANSINVDGGVFIFGTDWLGRDIFSNLLFAARNMVVMTLIAGIITFAIGLVYGIMVGYYQDSYADTDLKITSGFLLVLPIISLLILARYHVDSQWGNEGYMIIVAISVVITGIFRHVRALVVQVKQRDFVLVAIMRGEKSFYIIVSEILPNIIKPLLADILVRCSQIVIVIALIGFLGLAASPSANWGSMVREGQQYIDVMGYYLFIPCIAIISLVLGLNLMALSIECDEE